MNTGRSDGRARARVVQHRRRVAAGDRGMEQRLSLRDDEPLLGCGATEERRTDGDPSIAHEADIVQIGRPQGRRSASGRAFVRRLVALAVALRRRGAAREPRHHRGARRGAAARLRRARALSRLPADDGVVLRKLRRRECRSDCRNDRLLWRRRHLRLLAAAGARLRRGDDAGQHPRLGERYAFPLSAAALATVDLPVCVVRGGQPPPRAARQRVARCAHRPRQACDDRGSGAFHDRDPRRRGRRCDRRARPMQQPPRAAGHQARHR